MNTRKDGFGYRHIGCLQEAYWASAYTQYSISLRHILHELASYMTQAIIIYDIIYDVSDHHI